MFKIYSLIPFQQEQGPLSTQIILFPLSPITSTRTDIASKLIYPVRGDDSLIRAKRQFMLAQGADAHTREALILFP